MSNSTRQHFPSAAKATMNQLPLIHILFIDHVLHESAMEKMETIGPAATKPITCSVRFSLQ